MKYKNFDTLSVHSGQKIDLTYNSVMNPIYATSTYSQEKLLFEPEFAYSRVSNPTRKGLETALAQLEGGKHCTTFSSGMAAITSVMNLFKSGDHIIVSRNVYGGVYRLFEEVLKNYGLNFSWVDTSDIKNLKNSLTKKTKMVYIETPTNPLMEITDIESVAEICKKAGILLVVDNTFMTPVFQNPLKLGADIVVHSTTKYLNGHSDSLGGAVICNDDEIGEKIKFICKTTGAVLSPFEAFLILRGIKTLFVRMQKHEENGKYICQFLLKQKKVKRVFYPMIEKNRKIHEKQSRGYGAMVSFEVSDFKIVKKFFKKIKLFTLAESLGGVESLVCHPATMTHASIPKKIREELGIKDNLIRLSVGIENKEDLVSDIESALKG